MWGCGLSFVYHSSVGEQYPSHRDYKYGVEDLFQQLLASSRFRTEVGGVREGHNLPDVKFVCGGCYLETLV